MLFFITAAGYVCPFNYVFLALYTLCCCVMRSLDVGSPGGSVRTWKKASLYLGRGGAQQCWKDILAHWNSLFRIIKRQPPSFGETGMMSELGRSAHTPQDNK